MSQTGKVSAEGSLVLRMMFYEMMFKCPNELPEFVSTCSFKRVFCYFEHRKGVDLPSLNNGDICWWSVYGDHLHLNLLQSKDQKQQRIDL